MYSNTDTHTNGDMKREDLSVCCCMTRISPPGNNTVLSYLI